MYDENNGKLIFFFIYQIVHQCVYLNSSRKNLEILLIPPREFEPTKFIVLFTKRLAVKLVMKIFNDK